jgi:hypothetical protein
MKFWISIDTSKQSAYYVDSKDISLIKFSDSHQNLRAWGNSPDF